MAVGERKLLDAGRTLSAESTRSRDKPLASDKRYISPSDLPPGVWSIKYLIIKQDSGAYPSATIRLGGAPEDRGQWLRWLSIASAGGAEIDSAPHPPPVAGCWPAMSRFEDWQPRSKRLFLPRGGAALCTSTPPGYFLHPAALPSLALPLGQPFHRHDQLSLSSLLSSRRDFRPREYAPCRIFGTTGLSCSSCERVFCFRVSLLFFFFFFLYREAYYLSPKFFPARVLGCWLKRFFLSSFCLRRYTEVDHCREEFIAGKFFRCDRPEELKERR